MKSPNFPLNITEPSLLEGEQAVLKMTNSYEFPIDWYVDPSISSDHLGPQISPLIGGNYMSARVRCAQRWHILANIRRAGSSRRSTRAIALMTKKSSKGLMLHTKPVFSANDSE